MFSLLPPPRILISDMQGRTTQPHIKPLWGGGMGQPKVVFSRLLGGRRGWWYLFFSLLVAAH